LTGALVTTKSKSRKKNLTQSKSLPKLRTTTVVKGPGNLSSFKPPVTLARKRDH
jgi:hypothetical protein